MELKVNGISTTPVGFGNGNPTGRTGGLAASQLARRAMHAAKAGHHYVKTSTHSSNKSGIRAANSSDGSTNAASDAAASFVNFLQDEQTTQNQPTGSLVGASVQESFLANNAYPPTTAFVLAK